MMNNYYNPMQQQMNYGYNPYFGGTRYGAPAPNFKFTQPLTAEDAKILKDNIGKFTLNVTQKDVARAKCTHKDLKTGQIALRQNQDGTFTCMECGETFTLLPPELAGADKIDEIVSNMNDLLNSIKTYYVNCGDKVIIDYFSMMPFIKKAAEFYKESVKAFSDCCRGYNGITMNNEQSGWGVLGNIASPGFGNPMFNAGYNMNPANYAYGVGNPNQPVYGQQPPMYNQQVAPNVNPFSSNGQGYPYGQQMYDPNQMQQPQQQMQQPMQQQIAPYGQSQIPPENVTTKSDGKPVATKEQNVVVK